MRTEVCITFDARDVAGGARIILDRAGCGPDVAAVEDIPILRRLDVEVRLDASDRRLSVLLDLLRAYGLDWLEFRRDHYTEEELSAARLLIMEGQHDYQVFGGPRVGTTYDMSSACPTCGAGARQTSAQLIDGDNLSRIEGLRATSTYYSDILVDEALAEQLEAMALSGVSFRSVYAVMSDKRQLKQRWQQLCTTHTLPPMSPRSTGIALYQICPVCGRSGFSAKMNDPTRLVYHAKDLASAGDVNLTWEWFGGWKYNGNTSEALFAYPWCLVTPRVWRTFKDADVKSFRWIPIRVDEDQ